MKSKEELIRSALVDADHLANLSESLISSISAYDEAVETCGDMPSDAAYKAMQVALEIRNDTIRAMESAIYEYRKRVDRCMSDEENKANDNKPVYLKVVAKVRYWEDASVDGVDDIYGSLVPFGNGKAWKPIIRLSDGQIMGWPQDTCADIHYKVCDAGEYWLLNEEREEIAKWGDYYVPDKMLCHGDRGHGDYIIFKVDKNGLIENFRSPEINADQWDCEDGRSIDLEEKSSIKPKN